MSFCLFVVRWLLRAVEAPSMPRGRDAIRVPRLSRVEKDQVWMGVLLDP